mgnify:CR=1 FL=1
MALAVAPNPPFSIAVSPSGSCDGSQMVRQPRSSVGVANTETDTEGRTQRGHTCRDALWRHIRGTLQNLYKNPYSETLLGTNAKKHAFRHKTTYETMRHISCRPSTHDRDDPNAIGVRPGRQGEKRRGAKGLSAFHHIPDKTRGEGGF